MTLNNVEELTVESGNHCKLFTLEVTEWPQVEKPRKKVRSVKAYIHEQIQNGRGESLAQGRMELAAKIRAVADDPPMLRELRLAKGLSQADLAAMIETSQPRVARLEASREQPSLPTLRKLAAALEVDLNTIGQAFK